MYDFLWNQLKFVSDEKMMFQRRIIQFEFAITIQKIQSAYYLEKYKHSRNSHEIDQFLEFSTRESLDDDSFINDR